MKKLFLAIKDSKAVVVEVHAADDDAMIDASYHAAGKALGIDAADTGNIDLDLLREVTLGVPVDISEAV